MILEKLLDIVAPNTCLICEQENGAICLWCLPDAFQQVPNRCFRCLSTNSTSEVCKKCRRYIPMSHVWCATLYRENAEALVKHMKFNPDRSACRIIARWLDQTMLYITDSTITYVPTAPKRVRQRGFDHSWLIAKEFARLRNLPFEELLARTGSMRQVGSKKELRMKQAKGAYRSINKKKITPKIVVIDDIVTTGATIGECARVLKEAGAREVDGIVFAQTV